MKGNSDIRKMANMIKSCRKVIGNLSPLDLFLFISLTITGCFFIANWIKDGGVLKQCVLSAYDEFSDYFMHVVACADRKNLYSLSESFCFPPLAYCMYLLLWKMNPLSGNDILEWRDFKQSDNALFVFVTYNVIIVILFLYCIICYYNSIKAKYVLLLPLAIFFSYPVYCTSIQRGNSVMLVSLMTAFAWLWMDSDSKIKQEIAMVLIAVAAGFKFYPAIIGVVYIKDYKKLFRLIIYGLIAVFVPFVFFGGIDGARNLINILLNLSATDVMYRYGTVRGMVETISSQNFKMDVDLAYTIGGIAENVFLVISLVSAFYAEKKWQRVLFFSGILASYVSSSWMYTSVYYMPALLMFLKENKQNIKESIDKAWLILNILCFSLMFSIPFFFIKIFPGQIYEGVFAVSYILLFVNEIYVFSGIIKRKNRKLYIK